MCIVQVKVLKLCISLHVQIIAYFLRAVKYSIKFTWIKVQISIFNLLMNVEHASSVYNIILKT